MDNNKNNKAIITNTDKPTDVCETCIADAIRLKNLYKNALAEIYEVATRKAKSDIYTNPHTTPTELIYQINSLGTEYYKRTNKIAFIAGRVLYV